MLGTLPIFVLTACPGNRDGTVAADTAGAIAATHIALADSSPAGGTSVASTTPALTARQPAAPPARDADQGFLRDMLDHHETVLAIVHDQMMEPLGHAAHGKKADPLAWDAKLDVEKREMLALLRKYYDEDYSPRAAVPAATGAGGSGDADPMPMGEGKTTSEQEAEKMMRVQVVLMDQLRDGVRLAGRSAPMLERREVRELARRMRALQLELANELDAQMRKP